MLDRLGKNRSGRRERERGKDIRENHTLKQTAGVSSMWRCDVNVFVIVNRGGMHEAGYLTFFLVKVFIVIIHSGFVEVPLGSSFSVQVVAKEVDTFAAENTKHFTLLTRELIGGWATEDRELFAQK